MRDYWNSPSFSLRPSRSWERDVGNDPLQPDTMALSWGWYVRRKRINFLSNYQTNPLLIARPWFTLNNHVCPRSASWVLSPTQPLSHAYILMTVLRCPDNVHTWRWHFLTIPSPSYPQHSFTHPNAMWDPLVPEQHHYLATEAEIKLCEWVCVRVRIEDRKERQREVYTAYMLCWCNVNRVYRLCVFVYVNRSVLLSL